jgi:hypothetical protein
LRRSVVVKGWYMNVSLLLVFDHPGHNTLGLGPPSGHLQGGGSLRRGGVLVETGWMSLIEWGHGVITGGLRVGMRSIGLREVRGVQVPEASGPDFTGATVAQASPSDIEGEGAELGASGRGG